LFQIGHSQLHFGFPHAGNAAVLGCLCKASEDYEIMFERSCFGFQGVKWQFYINTNHDVLLIFSYIEW